ncbi:MAG: glycosyltransferase family 4 protein [Pyrinomonadaceae bacterium]|nr:glycosyltransferase family 4 protein [Pyrinomonadaceae bacterium]
MASNRVSAKPLHLLIVSNTENPTSIQGADRDWVNLLNALGPERVRVTWAGVSRVELLREYLDNKLDVRFINLCFEPFYELFHQSMYRGRTMRAWVDIIGRSIKSLRRPVGILRQAMGKDLPDVVITNTSVVLIGAAYAFPTRLPHIWCVKEFLDPAVADCRRYARLIKKLSDVVVVPSAAMAQVFNGHIQVLHDGNDITAIRSNAAEASRDQVLSSLGLPAGQLVIAQIGALSWAKGQQVTARACAQLALDGNGPCSLLFLGFAKPDVKEELRRILAVTPDGWQSSVRFVEFTPGDFSYLSAADIIVHPSVLPDPYPNAIREALILGKPVIGSRVGGIPELIANGLTGILIEPDNPNLLAEALKTLISSPEERARMGAAARRFAETSLDIDICKHAFFDTLVSVVRSKHNLRDI